MASRTNRTSPIIVVGAGVFGLSTAIHLAQRGYTNVAIIDKQAYQESQYSYNSGCDAASADINKIIRVAYGSEIEYQNLALDALAHWKRWNAEICTGQTLPEGFDQSDTLYVNNGNLCMSSQSSLGEFELDSIDGMKRSGFARTQVLLTNAEDVEQATADGFGFAVNPFNRKENFGLLDTVGGFVYADKACRFALHKAQTLGVRTILGGNKGTFVRFLHDPSSRVIGVQTADGTSHLAQLTIMACGGWTPSLVPELDHLCETTAGSVCIFNLSRGSALWDRFAPENFPTWTYKIKDGESGGLYGFARDSLGAVKIGYRGTKYTNPQTQPDGTVRSVPITRWTQESIRSLPQTAAEIIKAFIQEFLPELVSCPMKSRLCWYTDSFDNHFVIDFVPGFEGLMVATGGSGHGFKFLPNLGDHVVNRVEGKKDSLLDLWKWRSSETGSKALNSIMEGMTSKRALQNQVLTAEDRLSVHQSRL